MAAKKRLLPMLLLLILVCLSVMAITGREARADTKITVTIAAGGVAGGVYFFLRLAFAASAFQKLPLDAPGALINFGPDGWRFGPPILAYRPNYHQRHPFPAFPTPTDSAIVNLEILRIRF